MSARVLLTKAREGDARLTNAVVLLLGLALFLLTRQFVDEYDHFTFGFDHVSLMSGLVYVAAAALVLTQPVNRWTFRIIVAVSVACYIVVYLQEPFSSTDIYRYVWDGIVQHAHVNPYRYVPGNAALAFLREPNKDVFENINRRDYAPTIYPPVAQIVYWAVVWFAPTVSAMKLGMLAFQVLTAWALLQLLKHLGRRREAVLLYVWCPLLIWEIGLSGHVDAALIAFIALALLFRYRENPWLTGLFLGLAIFTKFYPAVLFPALWTRRDWKMPTAVAMVGVVSYSFYLSAGKQVFGFLSGYQQEEGMSTGARYFLLAWAQELPGLHHLPVAAYLLFCALMMGAITWWAWKWATVEVTLVPPVSSGTLGYEVIASERKAPVYLRVAAAYALAMMLLFSPHYPWYVAWLVPFFVVAFNVPSFVYVMSVFYWFTTAWADPGPKFFHLNQWLYTEVAVAMVVAFAMRKRPIRR